MKYQRTFTTGFSRIYEDEDLLYIVPLKYTLIIGVVGFRGVGKRTIMVNHLVQKKGFKYYSLSNIVREETEKRGLDLRRRENLQDMGDILRKEYGSGYLAKEIIKQIRYDLIEKGEEARYICIEGLKNPDEIRIFSKLRNFFLLGVDASDEDRWNWLKKAGFIPQTMSLDEFRNQEKRDRGIGQPEYGQNVSECMKIVERVSSGSIIENSAEKELKSIYESIDKKIEEMLQEASKTEMRGNYNEKKHKI